MEVDHRSKNALAVVNSIVRLSRANDATGCAEAITRRVQVLAEAHSLLAQRGWQEILPHDLVREQLRPLDPARVAFDGDCVMISALMVQPIALVLHELIDSAVRRGALSASDGALDVRWTGTGSYGGFELQWREDGVLSPPSVRRDGFGGALISAMVERQLRGQVDRPGTARRDPASRRSRTPRAGEIRVGFEIRGAAFASGLRKPTFKADGRRVHSMPRKREIHSISA